MNKNTKRELVGAKDLPFSTVLSLLESDEILSWTKDGKVWANKNDESLEMKNEFFQNSYVSTPSKKYYKSTTLMMDGLDGDKVNSAIILKHRDPLLGDKGVIVEVFKDEDMPTEHPKTELSLERPKIKITKDMFKNIEGGWTFENLITDDTFNNMIKDVRFSDALHNDTHGLCEYIFDMNSYQIKIESDTEESYGVRYDPDGEPIEIEVYNTTFTISLVGADKEPTHKERVVSFEIKTRVTCG